MSINGVKDEHLVFENFSRFSILDSKFFYILYFDKIFCFPSIIKEDIAKKYFSVLGGWLKIRKVLIFSLD